MNFLPVSIARFTVVPSACTSIAPVFEAKPKFVEREKSLVEIPKPPDDVSLSKLKEMVLSPSVNPNSP